MFSSLGSGFLAGPSPVVRVEVSFCVVLTVCVNVFCQSIVFGRAGQVPRSVRSSPASLLGPQGHS